LRGWFVGNAIIGIIAAAKKRNDEAILEITVMRLIGMRGGKVDVVEAESRDLSIVESIGGVRAIVAS
jgi:hypothetical protein